MQQLTLPLALDAMGGDHAPDAVIYGAHMALERHPGLKFLLFGDEAKIAPLLDALPQVKAASQLIHTDVAIADHEKPSAALRQGKQSSMRLAIDAVEQKRAFGVVSSGNTGALMAMSKIVLRMLPGISRPAIVALFPTMRGECVILDLGANVECDARDLFNFAIMGDAFARSVLGCSKPKIGLLNIGSEELKGNEIIKEAAAMMREFATEMDFHGFVEGNHIAEGIVDVVVTDGFTGNVALKTAEGTARLIRSYMKDAFLSTWLTKLGALLGHSALGVVKEKLDARKRNGAMFVGLNGIAVKSHGRADPKAFCNAISVAVDLAAHNINDKILHELQLYNDVHGERKVPAKGSL